LIYYECGVAAGVNPPLVSSISVVKFYDNNIMIISIICCAMK